MAVYNYSVVRAYSVKHLFKHCVWFLFSLCSDYNIIALRNQHIVFFAGFAHKMRPHESPFCKYSLSICPISLKKRRIQYKIDFKAYTEVTMDKLRENLSRFISRIKKGAYRQAKLSRAAGRRFSQGMAQAFWQAGSAKAADSALRRRCGMRGDSGRYNNRHSQRRIGGQCKCGRQRYAHGHKHAERGKRRGVCARTSAHA